MNNPSEFPASRIVPEGMAAALGVPLYRTQHFLPTYAKGQYGRWKLVQGGFVLDRGYHSGVWGVAGLPALLRDRHGDGQVWETWMSLSPHEIESQELAIRHARGHTVIMGLGMGWVAANIALNPAVTQVTVIERDPEVIELFSRAQGFAELPEEARAKLSIVEADALDWRPEQSVDFLYADIWRTLEEPQTLDDVRRMQANVAAHTIYFWGQELSIHALAEPDRQTLNAAEWAESVVCCMRERIGLPLLLPDDFDYPDFIAKVAAQRRQRWPSGKERESAD